FEPVIRRFVCVEDRNAVGSGQRSGSPVTNRLPFGATERIQVTSLTAWSVHRTTADLYRRSFVVSIRVACRRRTLRDDAAIQCRWRLRRTRRLLQQDESDDRDHHCSQFVVRSSQFAVRGSQFAVRTESLNPPAVGSPAFTNA